jgi:O-acetyl-ADP-ribose deacetylase (regulator of RNase III)
VTKFALGTSSVECVQGDITNQPDIEAVVNAANAALLPGGGVAGAIHRAAGPGLYEECRPLAPIRPGQAVITGGHRLPNRFVIHCLGPVYGVDVPSAALLADCYRNALRIAGERGIRSIAFPAISAGVFGYPMEEAAQVAVQVVGMELARRPTIRQVRFVLFDRAALRTYERLLEGSASSNRK